MAFPFWSLIPAATNFIGSLIRKPTQFKPDTSGYDKAISNLQQRQASNAVYKAAVRPQAKKIGREAGRARRDIGYSAAKQGLSGTGIEAQQKISLTEKVLGAYQDVSESALDRQTLANERGGERIDALEIQKQQVLNQAQQANQQQQDQYQQGIVSGLVGLAGAGIGAYGQYSAAQSAAELTQAQETLALDYAASSQNPAEAQAKIESAQADFQAGRLTQKQTQDIIEREQGVVSGGVKDLSTENIAEAKATEKARVQAQKAEVDARGVASQDAAQEFADPEEYLAATEKIIGLTEKQEKDVSRQYRQKQKDQAFKLVQAERGRNKNRTPQGKIDAINKAKVNFNIKANSYLNILAERQKSGKGDQKHIDAINRVLGEKQDRFTFGPQKANELKKLNSAYAESLDLTTSSQKIWLERIESSDMSEDRKAGMRATFVGDDDIGKKEAITKYLNNLVDKFSQHSGTFNEKGWLDFINPDLNFERTGIE